MRVIFALCLFLFGCVSCHKKEKSYDCNKQSIRLNIQTDPPTLDARKATDTSSISVINMCFEGLMKRGKEGKIHPAIAHRVEISNDRKIYTFYLRDAKWWDGKPVTAQDFEKTWKQILDPQFSSGFANDLYVIKNARKAKRGKIPVDCIGIKSIDNQTLVVELKNPIPYFLDLTASHSFLAIPTHIAEVNPKWAEGNDLSFVGNGPYRLKRWKHHNCIELVKNESYWDQEAVTIREIHLSIIEDPMTELNMFETGDLEWAGYPLSTLPTDALQPLAHANRLKTYPLAGTYYYIFNVTEPPFDNVNFRKAFSFAINRSIITENIIHSEQPATSLIPPNIWEVHPYFDDNDIKEARRLFDIALKQMGYTYETLPRITLIYNTCEAHHKIAQAIQEQWFRAFGIRVKLINKEWKVFLDELTHKQFQIARMGGVAGFNDPITFLDAYKYPKNPNNFSGWTHPQFTKLLVDAEKMADSQKREILLREAEALLMAEMPIVPIYYYRGNYVKKSCLKGVQLSDLHDLDFKFAFLEK